MSAEPRDDAAEVTRSSADDAERSGTRIPVWTLRAASLLLAVEVFLQEWGRIIHDTRTDLAIDPVRFLSTTWHLWDPLADMGRVQNQAAGYLIPMGPFFLAGKALEIPTWIVQRAWISLVLIAAFWGFARLLDELGIGSVFWRVVGATAYALGPYFLARGAAISAVVLGGALLPWVMIPLVRGSRRGSPRRAAAASAVAVLLMGGANGAVTLAVLVVPCLYLLTRERGPRRAALTRWWLLATAAACSWWFGALVLQVLYGINFITFTERAATTTGFTPPFEIIRGTADWLAYVTLWNVPLPAGFALVSEWALVLATGLLAAAGLYGLSRRDIPERRFLVTCFVVGVALVGAGFGGGLGNPSAPLVRDLLDGPLAPFRTVYKFAPVVMLPLAVGFVHGMDRLTGSLRATDARARWRARLVPTIAVLLVFVAVSPLFLGKLTTRGGFEEVPAYWTAARDFVAAEGGRTLELPGLPFADFNWGIPEDDPFNWDTEAPWATRSIAPLGSPAATRYRGGVEAAISRGGDAGLIDALRAGGFSTVTVRNDASSVKYLAPTPAQVNGALQASGLTLVASFGPQLQLSAQDNPDGLVLHSIDVYGVDDPSIVDAYTVDDAAILSGGPESPMALAAAGLAPRGYILTSDLAGLSTPPPNWVITDGNAYRYTYFGVSRDNASYVLAANDGAPNGQSLDAGLDPRIRRENQTIAELDGVASVSASSTGSWLLGIPEAAPYRAVDGDPSTAWISGPRGTSVGEWLQIDLDQPTSAPSIEVAFLRDGPWRPQVDAVRITTDAGEVVQEVGPGEDLQTLSLPPGSASWIRLTIAEQSASTSQASGVGIREVAVPGVTVSRRLVMPSELLADFADPATPMPTYSFQRSRLDPGSFLRSDEEPNMARRFEVPRSAPMAMTARVAAEPGDALLELVNNGGAVDDPAALTIHATSTFRDLPRYAVRNLFDGDDSTTWVAAGITSVGDAEEPVAVLETDPDPQITVAWAGTRTVADLRIDRDFGRSTPSVVRVSNGTETREGAVGPDGWVRFEPIVGDHLTLSFPVTSRVNLLSATPGGDQPLTRPLGLAGIEIPGLAGLWPAADDPDAPLSIGCEAGPTVRVGDRTIRLAVDTTREALTSLQSVDATVCDDPVVALDAGSETLDTDLDGSAFNVTSVTLVDRDDPPPPPGPSRTVEPRTWDATERSIAVGPGEASYVVLNENANRGWVATLDGQELEPTVLDGWRQAYVVPAGSGGIVDLRFGPDATYQRLLIAGLVLALLPIALAVLPSRRREQPEPIGAGRWPPWLLGVPAVVGGFLIGGPVVLLLVPLVLLRRRRPSWSAALAGGSYALATIWVAATLQPSADAWSGAFSNVATILALVAFLTVAATLVEAPTGSEPGGPDEPRLPAPGPSAEPDRR